MTSASPPSSRDASSATPRSESEDSDIVVRGRLRNALQNFVASLTQTGPTEQIARWKDDICPALFGMDSAQADFMGRRIEALANSVRLRTRHSNCATTMMIVVTPDAAGFARELARQLPVTLRTDGFSRLKRFVSSTKPVRWLSVTDECGGGCSLPNSRLTMATRPTFRAMLVIVDAHRIGGINLGELSDYVAMVALSNPPADVRARSSSILSMNEESRVPGTHYQLTDYDRSFLSGLYGSAIDGSGREQRSSIVRRMKRDRHGKPQTAEGESPQHP